MQSESFMSKNRDQGIEFELNQRIYLTTPYLESVI